MAKYKIEIEIETSIDIPEQVMNEVTDAASVQLESLDDGDYDIIYKYILTSATWKRLP